MVITAREWMQTNPKEIQVWGKYHIKEVESRESYCKCGFANSRVALICQYCLKRLRA